MAASWSRTLPGATGVNQGDTARYSCVFRDEIGDENLDIAWLRASKSQADEHLNESEEIAAAIPASLRAAMTRTEAVPEELAEVEVVRA